ncbi:MAG: hypothetical protein GY774_35425 [Planctomycetes bacterium]|nr:hypothetical protein [Planctomycetota bacterium]
MSFETGKKMMDIPDKFMPLIYLIVVAIIAGVFHKLGVPATVTGLIVGAGLTRIRIGKGSTPGT